MIRPHNNNVNQPGLRPPAGEGNCTKNGAPPARPFSPFFAEIGFFEMRVSAHCNFYRKSQKTQPCGPETRIAPSKIANFAKFNGLLNQANSGVNRTGQSESVFAKPPIISKATRPICLFWRPFSFHPLPTDLRAACPPRVDKNAPVSYRYRLSLQEKGGLN